MEKLDHNNIKYIIIHCTATPFDVSLDLLHKWHVNENGWEDIGYHYLISMDGTIYPCRSLEYVGAHCYGKNRESVGIAYSGGTDCDMKPCDTRTQEQKESLLKLIKETLEKFPNAIVVGHNKFSTKSCPCFDAENEYKYLSKC